MPTKVLPNVAPAEAPAPSSEDYAAGSQLDASGIVSLAPSKFRKAAGQVSIGEAVLKSATEFSVSPSAHATKVWTVADWLEREGAADVLAAVLVGDKTTMTGEVDVTDQRDELWVVREFVAEHGSNLEKEVRKRIAESIRSVADFLVPKLRALVNTAELKAKSDAQEKFGMNDQLACKNETLSAYYGGLEGKIGLPDPDVMAGVEEEHTLRDDSKSEFGSGHYEITTTSHAEWRFVFEPTAFEPFGREVAAKERTTLASPAVARTPMRLDEVRHRLRAVNTRLPAGSEPHVSEAEALCARLWTGPMFIKYNAALRGYGQMVADIRGNSYATTIHAINSMIVKTSVLTKVAPVYRGIGGGTLPDWFWTTSAHGVHGCVDAAFTSTSLDRELVTDYSPLAASSQPKAAAVFEIFPGLRDRGAQLEWISQWPHEHEVVLPPLSSLEVQSTRVEGCVLVIKCLLCVNLVPHTIEQVLARRQKVVRDACEQYVLRTVHHVEEDEAWEVVRDLHPNGAARRLVKTALQHTLTMASERASVHYSDDDALCSAIQTAARQSSACARWAQEMRTLLRYLPNDNVDGTRDVRTLLTVPHLDLSQKFLGRAEAIGLCGMLILNTDLTALNLLFNEFSHEDAEALASLAKWREPPLSLCGISYRQAEAKFVSDVKLKTADAILLAADLHTRPGLAKLVLDENPLGLEGCRVLCESLASMSAHSHSHLTQLYMANTGMGPHGAAYVASALRNRWTVISHLSLGFNRIGPDGARALAAALEVNGTLIALNLHYNALSDDGVVAIVRALQANGKSKLAALTLSSNLLTAAAAEVLGAALADGSVAPLERLDLSWNKLYSEGGAALCAALEAIEVDDTRALALSLRSCNLDGEAKASLKAVAAKSPERLELIGLGDKA